MFSTVTKQLHPNEPITIPEHAHSPPCGSSCDGTIPGRGCGWCSTAAGVAGGAAGADKTGPDAAAAAAVAAAGMGCGDLGVCVGRRVDGAGGGALEDEDAEGFVSKDKRNDSTEALLSCEYDHLPT